MVSLHRNISLHYSDWEPGQITRPLPVAHWGELRTGKAGEEANSLQFSSIHTSASQLATTAELIQPGTAL